MSSWDDLRLQVTPGTGLVARSAAALLVVPAVAEHQQPVLERLVALTQDARPASGRSLARKVAGIVASSEPEEVPDLAFFADLGGSDVAVLVLGEAEVSADTTAGSISLSGRESLTWVDKVLQAPTRIVVGLPDHAQPVPMLHVDLRDGVVPGGGALLEPREPGTGAGARSTADAVGEAGSSPDSSVSYASASAPSVDEDGEANPPRIETSKPAVDPEPAPLPAYSPPPVGLQPPPTGPSASAVASPYGGPLTDPMPVVEDEHDVPPQRATDFQVEPIFGEPESPREPLPVEPETQADAPDAAPESELVEGVYCKRGHFTDPDSQFCIVCGIGLYETKIKRKGVRPELGFLVFDDGSVFHLDHDYVLGRQPEVDEEVKSGSVRGLRLDDSGGTVSRAHAIVRLEGWNVTIADRKSQNGTLVAGQGSDQFVPVTRDQPVTLVPGSRIQLGQRTLVYESQRGRS